MNNNNYGVQNMPHPCVPPNAFVAVIINRCLLSIELVLKKYDLQQYVYNVRVLCSVFVNRADNLKLLETYTYFVSVNL